MAEKENIKAKPMVKKEPDIYYSVDEIAHSGAYGCPPECVYAAFKELGLQRATENEAQKIVANFLKREVK